MPNWITPPAEYDHDKPLHVNKQRDRGTLLCTCGKPVSLDGAIYGPHYAADCQHCGRLYNLSGQALSPMAEWTDFDASE